MHALFAAILLATTIMASSADAASNGRLRIEGVSRAQESNLRAWVGEPVAVTENALRAFMRRAEPDARRAMQALGYYHASFEFSIIRDDKSGPMVRIRVVPGDPVVVDHISFVVSGDAADDGTYKLLRERWKLGPGDAFHHGLWDDSKRSIRELLRRRGYLEHYVKVQEARVELAARKAWLDLRIESGSRYAFGRTLFEGSQIDPQLMQGYLPWQAGEPYDLERVRRLERALQDTRFFSAVEVTTHPQAADREIEIHVKVVARERNVLSVGPGVATDTGPRMRLGWEKPWLGPSGHAWRADIEVSGVRNAFESAYTIPLTPPRSRSLEYNLNWTQEAIDDHESERLRTALQHRRLGLFGWETVYFLRLEQERFDIGDDEGTSLLLMPGTSWTRTRRQGGALATWGDRVYIEAQGASEAVVSDLSLMRLQLGARWLRSLYAGSRLHLRVDAGTLLTDQFENTPSSLRFFAGGDRSIRGFSYQSLGPRDASGEVVGGRQLLVGSVEFDWRVTPDWRAAVFVDGGGAFDSTSDSYQFGLGGGARWLSPVGPVRIDLAMGVDGADIGFRLHFSLGPDL